MYSKLTDLLKRALAWIVSWIVTLLILFAFVCAGTGFAYLAVHVAAIWYILTHLF